MNAVEVREQLVHALRCDLVGPEPESPLATEVLPQSPSRWYLTGFLVPQEAPADQRGDDTTDDQPDLFDEKGGADDAAAPEPAAARRAFFPSSVGLSVLVPGSAKQMRATVTWGDYRPDYHKATIGEESEEQGEPVQEDELLLAGADLFGKAIAPSGGKAVAERAVRRWKRTDRREEVTLKLPTEKLQAQETDVPNSGGLKLVLAVRPVQTVGIAEKLVPKGTRSVSVFLVNQRRPAGDASRDEAYAFQALLQIECDEPLVPRPNLRGLETNDEDEQIADLQYADVCEFAVGHGAATHAELSECQCRVVRTCWIPAADVERVAPAPVAGVDQEMEKLATLASGQEARNSLGQLVALYRTWIEAQRVNLPSDLSPQRTKTAAELLRRATVAANRIEAGIALLADDQVREAFCLANKVMARAGRQRDAARLGKQPGETAAPAWRPFQLAFLLMNLPGIADPRHADREAVDLLFFPTGGGKTEAYLGLAAFTLVLRRLRNPGICLRRPERADALHPATADPRPVEPGRNAYLRPGAGTAAGTPTSWASGLSRSACGLAERRRRTGWAQRETPIRTRRGRGPSPSRTTTATNRRRSRWRTARGAARSSRAIRSSSAPTRTSRSTCASAASTATATSAASSRCRSWRWMSRSIADYPAS